MKITEEITDAITDAITALKWAQDNMKPDRPELQSDVFNILTNAIVGLEHLVRIPSSPSPLTDEEIERKNPYIENATGLHYAYKAGCEFGRDEMLKRSSPTNK